MSNDLGYTPMAAVAYKDPVTVSWGQGVLDNVTAIASLLADYQKGCRLRYVDANTIEVGTGCIMINGKPRRNTTTATVTFANTGGASFAETSSTGYYIWAIASGSTSTFEVALNLTAANHTGNANARCIGWLYNGTGQAIEQLYDNQYGKVLDNWLVRTENYGVQQAVTDGIVCAYVILDNQSTIAGYTDNNTPPTTIRVSQAGFGVNAANVAITFPVKRGDYWKVVASGTPTVYWIPIGGSIM